MSNDDATVRSRVLEVRQAIEALTASDDAVLNAITENTSAIRATSGDAVVNLASVSQLLVDVFGVRYPGPYDAWVANNIDVLAYILSAQYNALQNIEGSSNSIRDLTDTINTNAQQTVSNLQIANEHLAASRLTLSQLSTTLSAMNVRMAQIEDNTQLLAAVVTALNANNAALSGLGVKLDALIACCEGGDIFPLPMPSCALTPAMQGSSTNIVATNYEYNGAILDVYSVTFTDLNGLGDTLLTQSTNGGRTKLLRLETGNKLYQVNTTTQNPLPRFSVFWNAEEVPSNGPYEMFPDFTTMVVQQITDPLGTGTCTNVQTKRMNATTPFAVGDRPLEIFLAVLAGGRAPDPRSIQIVELEIG